MFLWASTCKSWLLGLFRRSSSRRSVTPLAGSSRPPEKTVETSTTLSPKSDKLSEPWEAQLRCRCCGKSNLHPELIPAIVALRSALGSAEFPFTITSGYRCTKHNKAVGGALKSYHTRGMAIDLAVVGEARQSRLIEAALRSGFGGIGRANAFIHLDLGPRRRWTY